LAGELIPVGSGYLVTAKLVASANGDVLASGQQPANSAAELIPAMDKLGRKLRAKIGESLRAVQNATALSKASTVSLDALRKYGEGLRAQLVELNLPRARGLYDSAIVLDSNFAMAYTRLAGTGGPRLNDVLAKGYSRRDQFVEGERLAFMAQYYRIGAHTDRAKSVAAYEELHRKYPETDENWLNLASEFWSRREYARAESLLVLTFKRDPEMTNSRARMVELQIAQGKLREAMQSAAEFRQFPALAERADRMQARVLYSAGKDDSAKAAFARGLSESPARADSANQDLATLSARDGRLRDWAKYITASRTIRVARGLAAPAINDSFYAINMALWIADHREEALQRLDATVARMPPATRLTRAMANRYGALGRGDRAKAIAASVDSAVTDTAAQRLAMLARHQTAGWIAFAEGRFPDAVAEFKAGDRLPDGPAVACAICVDPELGLAFDRAGLADSAIATYEHFVKTPYLDRLTEDALHLARILRRLGELYDAKNNAPKAIEYYQRFMALWKNADPELQPRVAAARARVQQLTDAQRRK
jgi:tetratricopeptide (TPR) repeat protein